MKTVFFYLKKKKDRFYSDATLYSYFTKFYSNAYDVLKKYGVSVVFLTYIFSKTISAIFSLALWVKAETPKPGRR